VALPSIVDANEIAPESPILLAVERERGGESKRGRWNKKKKRVGFSSSSTNTYMRDPISIKWSYVATIVTAPTFRRFQFDFLNEVNHKVERERERQKRKPSCISFSYRSNPAIE
jgi:hypothetical protein